MKKSSLLWGILLIGIFTFFLSHKNKTVTNTPQLIEVETTNVVEKVICDYFNTIGSLASLDQIDISSESSGQISAIYFKPGSWVKKDTLLIELDNTILTSKLASAKASLLLSEMNYKRIAELSKTHLSSQQALDQAAADLQQKKNDVIVSQVQLEKLSLHAPFSGTLGSRNVSIGQYVKVGQPLVSLTANQQLRVVYNLPERILPQLKLGQKVYVYSDAFPNKSYEGVINYISPFIDKETRGITVEAVINNKNLHLSTGLFVKIKHQLGIPIARLFVPEESVIPTISGQKIFILKDDKAFTKRVVTGNHHLSMIEIRKGLEKDEIVIIRGQHKLKEGGKVIAIKSVQVQK